MKLALQLIVSAVAVCIASYIVPGVMVTGFITALLVSIVLGLINTFLKPILFILTLPITILTLGLFSFVLNGLLVMLTGMIVPGFIVDNLFVALIFAVVLSIINLIFHFIGAR